MTRLDKITQGFVIAFAVSCLSCSITDSNGSLDTTFGSSGTRVFDISSQNQFAYAGALASDQKILVVGSSHDGTDHDFLVARFTTDGNLDTTFGTGGSLRVSLSSSADDIANSVSVQSDGKILVAGSFDNGINTDFAVIRLNTDGTLDSSFSGDGKYTIALGSNDEEATGILEGSGSTVVMGGWADDVGQDKFAVARLTSAGILDTSFSTDGKMVVAFGASNSKAYSMIQQTTGKIVLGGTTGSPTDSALARITTNGSIDTSFGSGGTVTLNAGGSDAIRHLAQNSSGSIFSFGWMSSSTAAFSVSKFSASGSIQTNFGTLGTATAAPCESAANQAYSGVVTSSGYIVAGGSTAPAISNDCSEISTQDFSSIKLSAFGNLDIFWGTLGGNYTDIGGGTDEIRSVLEQSDGKFVFVGYSNNGSNFDVALTRVNP